MAGRPVGSVFGDDPRELARPYLDQRTVGLAMELDPVDGAADTERLVGRHGAGCEMHCTLRQGEGIGMPMEERRAGAERRDERIGPTGLGRLHLFPAELSRPSEDVFG